MKAILKNLAMLCIGALSLLLADKASAQRGRISIGLGFGYRPGYYYNPYGGYYGYAYPRIGLSYGYLPLGYLPFYVGADLYYLNNGVYYRRYDDNYYHVVAPPVGAEVPRLPSHVRSIMIDNQQYFELSGVYYKTNVRPDGSADYVIAGKDGVLYTNGAPMPPPQGNMVPQPAPVNPQGRQPQPINTPPANNGQDSGPMALPPTPTDAQQTAAPVVTLKIGDIADSLPDGCKSVTVAGKKYFVDTNDIYYEEFNNKGKVGYRVAGTPDGK